MFYLSFLRFLMPEGHISGPTAGDGLVASEPGVLLGKLANLFHGILCSGPGNAKLISNFLCAALVVQHLEDGVVSLAFKGAKILNQVFQHDAGQDIGF